MDGQTDGHKDGQMDHLFKMVELYGRSWPQVPMVLLAKCRTADPQTSYHERERLMSILCKALAFWVFCH